MHDDGGIMEEIERRNSEYPEGNLPENTVDTHFKVEMMIMMIQLVLVRVWVIFLMIKKECHC